MIIEALCGAWKPPDPAPARPTDTLESSVPSGARRRSRIDLFQAWCQRDIDRRTRRTEVSLCLNARYIIYRSKAVFVLKASQLNPMLACNSPQPSSSSALA